MAEHMIALPVKSVEMLDKITTIIYSEVWQYYWWLWHSNFYDYTYLG